MLIDGHTVGRSLLRCHRIKRRMAVGKQTRSRGRQGHNP